MRRGNDSPAPAVIAGCSLTLLTALFFAATTGADALFADATAGPPRALPALLAFLGWMGLHTWLLAGARRGRLQRWAVLGRGISAGPLLFALGLALCLRLAGPRSGDAGPLSQAILFAALLCQIAAESMLFIAGIMALAAERKSGFHALRHDPHRRPPAVRAQPLLRRTRDSDHRRARLAPARERR